MIEDEGSMEDSDSPWLPPFEPFNVIGVSEQAVLETYWGDMWPEVEATLRAGLGDLNVDTFFLGDGIPEEALDVPGFLETGYQALQGRDEYLRNLEQWLLTDYDSPASSQFPYSRITLSLAAVDFASHAGFGASGVINSGVRRFAGQVAPELTLLDHAKVKKRALELHSGVIGDLLSELEATCAIVHGRIRGVLVRDLDRIGPDRLPERGDLFVGPFMATHLDASFLSDASSAHYFLTLFGGREVEGMDTTERRRIQNHWSACYTLDLRTVPELAATLTLAESERARISEAIRDLIVQELERGAE